MMVASVTSSRGMGLATAARERERGDWPFILSDAEVNLMRLEFLFLREIVCCAISCSGVSKPGSPCVQLFTTSSVCEWSVCEVCLSKLVCVCVCVCVCVSVCRFVCCRSSCFSVRLHLQPTILKGFF